MGRQIVFVVSADTAISDSVKNLVESSGQQAETFTSLQAFFGAVGPEHRGCLVLDVYVSDLIKPDWQAGIASASALMPCLLITDRGDVPTAVRAVKAGAMDIVQKPYRDQNLLDSIKNALRDDVAAQS